MLEVLALRGVLRSQLLTTDDSFQFNKVVARLKEAVTGLPDEPDPIPEAEGGRQTGIAALLEADAEGASVGAGALQALRRAFLLDCLEAGRVVYRWAAALPSVGAGRLPASTPSVPVRCPIPPQRAPWLKRPPVPGRDGQTIALSFSTLAGWPGPAPPSTSWWTTSGNTSVALFPPSRIASRP